MSATAIFHGRGLIGHFTAVFSTCQIRERGSSISRPRDTSLAVVDKKGLRPEKSVESPPLMRVRVNTLGDASPFDFRRVLLHLLLVLQLRVRGGGGALQFTATKVYG